MQTIDKGVNGQVYGQPLNRTESLLLGWLGGDVNERQAIALAKHIVLSENPTDSEIADAVMLALVAAKEAVSGRSTVKYLSGIRRDTLRGQK
jgi:hypothetical protein